MVFPQTELAPLQVAVHFNPHTLKGTLSDSDNCSMLLVNSKVMGRGPGIHSGPPTNSTRAGGTRRAFKTTNTRSGPQRF